MDTESLERRIAKLTERQTELEQRLAKLEGWQSRLEAGAKEMLDKDRERARA